MYVLKYGAHDFLKLFEDVKYFPRDQRLRLETPGWRVLGFEGNRFSNDDLQRQRERILRDLLAIKKREYPFAEDLIVDDSGTPDATMPVRRKVLSLIEVLRLGSPNERV